MIFIMCRKSYRDFINLRHKIAECSMAYQTPRKELDYGDIACLRRSVTVERGGRMVGNGLKRVNGENKGKNEGRPPLSSRNRQTTVTWILVAIIQRSFDEDT